LISLRRTRALKLRWQQLQVRDIAMRVGAGCSTTMGASGVAVALRGIFFFSLLFPGLHVRPLY
jgi:hypothetical protein